MEIKTTNDNKGRYQSFESKIIHDGSDSNGYYNVHFVGFGATKFESIQNLIQQVDNFIKNAKRINDNLPI